jgi:HEAT repeat protein
MQPNQPSEPASIKLRVEGQEVVGQIRNAPLQQVLEELAAWSGIIFEIESQENPQVTVTFYRVPLLEAIQRLTGNNNSIVYSEKDESGQNQIRLVRIFTRTPRPTPPSLHYLGAGAITKRSDDVVDSPEQALAVLSGSSNLAARQKAIEVLVATKGAPAIQALKTALTDPAVEIKVAAIEGLYTLGVHDALPQILLALKDEHPGVRQSAIIAVGLLGDAKNVKDLRPLLKDPDRSVAAAADVAIQKLSARRP